MSPYLSDRGGLGTYRTESLKVGLHSPLAHYCNRPDTQYTHSQCLAVSWHVTVESAPEWIGLPAFVVFEKLTVAL